MQLLLLFLITSFAWIYKGSPSSQNINKPALHRRAKDYVKNWRNDTDDTVTIAGYNGNSGTYPIGTDGSFMFYWFIESPEEDVNTSASLPLILWLQAGPGCSSMVGEFFEFGPIGLDYQQNIVFNSTTYEYDMTYDNKPQARAVNWSQKAHLLMIENPIGTGYSYAATDASYSTSMEEMAFNLYEVLIYLQGKYNTSYFNPNREFYIFGESYAGKYIPMIGATIIEHNLNTTETKINLKGVGIGDGFTDPLIQFTSVGEYALSWGLIDMNQQQQIIVNEQLIAQAIQIENWTSASRYWHSILREIESFTGGVNIYNFKNYTQYDTTYIDNWLQLDQVKELFHVPSFVQFQDCNEAAYFKIANTIPQSQAYNVAYLLEHVKVLLYNGQNDIIVSTPGAIRWVSNLNWSGQSYFQNIGNTVWKNSAGDVAGHYKHYGNLTQVVVYDAGHLVPLDQPVNALDMLTKFLNNEFSQFRNMGSRLFRCGEEPLQDKNTESGPSQNIQTKIEIEIETIDEEINAKTWIRRYLARRQFIIWKINQQRKHLRRHSKKRVYCTKAAQKTEALHEIIEYDQTQPTNIKTKYYDSIEIEKGSDFSGYLTVEGKLKYGYGIQIFPNGSKYEGNWENDLQSGFGRLFYPNGDMYQGYWKTGQPHGQGYFYSQIGGFYKGNWANGKQSGQGFEVFTDGSTYKGEYKNGQKHGIGKMKWVQGSRYVGSFKNDEFHGEGKYIWPNGKQYIGEWVKGKIQGKGRMIYPDGSQYEGDFLLDKIDGIGTFKWTNGKKYIGQWKWGKMHGTGTYSTNTQIKSGYWEYGKFIRKI